MASLLDLAQARLQGLLDIPTRVGRAVVNPTLFSGLLGAPTLPAQQGFAEGFAQLPAQTDMSVLDPNQAAYLQGYETGVPYGMAAAIAPFTKGMPIGASIKDVSKQPPLKTIFLGDKEIPVTMHKVEAKEGNQLVDVNTDIFDNAFKQTEWQYIGKNAEGGKVERLSGIQKFLETGKPMNASNVTVKDNGTIVFGDGRHRYAYLRDMGLGKIPMSMDAESLQNARRFGYID